MSTARIGLPTSIKKWETCLSRIGQVLENANRRRPESGIVDQFIDLVDELQELALAAEAERSAAISLPLQTILQQHVRVLSDCPGLKPYVDRVEQNTLTIDPPEDAAEILEDIDRNLRSIQELVDSLGKKHQQSSKSTRIERGKLLLEINELHAAETELYKTVESLFLRLFRESNSQEPVITKPTPANPLSITSEGFDDDDNSLNTEAEELPAVGSDGVSAPNPEITIGAEPRPLEVHQPGDAKPVQCITGEASDTSEHRDDSPTSSETSESIHRYSHLVAVKTLNGMLSSRRFARAYWLTRADDKLGNHALYGALCEGARIRPGDPCPGVLFHFFNRLAQKQRWNDDELLLLAASVLGSCLFVDPLPPDIYQLAVKLPDDRSPVARLMQRVRELCVHQNAKIHPKDLGEVPVSANRKWQLDKLESDANWFLQRVPYIRFQYAPADFAVRYLYRTGSEWHRLHTIVKGRHVNRLDEARSLVEHLDPDQVVKTLHNDGELTSLKRPLEGRARDKLTRHLHDTLALSKTWVGLISAADNGDQGGDKIKSIELFKMLNKTLPNTRRALEQANSRGAVDALNCVLEDIEKHISGGKPKRVDSIDGDLRLLPGLALEDDLEPAEKDLGILREAILNAENAEHEPEPETILNECMSRREYRRARDIIENCNLGERARDEYRRKLNDECSKLEGKLRDLELEIENAFLLGELRDDAQENEFTDDYSGNIERSKLLDTVQNIRLNLKQSESADGELRSISRKVSEVVNDFEQMALKRREKLECEFNDVMKELSNSDQEYLRKAFKECLNDNDHVAARDLLDRGRKAAQGPDPMVRASTGSSNDLELFLERARGYRNALSTKKEFQKLVESIEKGNTYLNIPFGSLDRVRRDEAASALKIWNSLTNLQYSKAHSELKNSLEELLRFIGLPLKKGGIEVADTTQSGFAHIRVTLFSPVTASPLPAFGSTNKLRYQVVVSQTRKEPEQFEEYIRARGLANYPVLALLLRPQSQNYRNKWQKHFARVRLTVLPFDSVLLLHLCGQRNRLPVFFNLGLPFTWVRPYITKGENVASEMFVGRDHETEALIRRRGSCIVFGGRQLGKSALLRHVRRKHNAPEKSIYVVYLDVNDLGTDSEGHDAMKKVFWRRVYDELIRCAAIGELSHGILTRDSRLVEAVPNSISTRLSEKHHMRIVLLLDETDNLLDCDSTRDFDLIRRIRSLMANTDRRFKAVFAGLQSVQRYYGWKNHPFAQLGEELVVNPLPPAEAQDLIIRPLRALGFAFENTRLMLRILSLTNYHPGLIQIIGCRLLDNLFDKGCRSDTAGPIRPITPEDLLAVEKNNSILEDIRNRFDWTLDLDDRYKVLTYALVLTPNPTAPQRESEFMVLGKDWWKAVFQDMDALGLRAVLDEMVGLGVLLREHKESVRTYRLRSPNLLRLLGPQQAIEDELLRIIERDRISRPNPRNFHPIVDRRPIAFGPLTNEQVSQICGQHRPFQLTLITGSKALGLDAVERQIDKLLRESVNSGNNMEWGKVQHAELADVNDFVEKLRNLLRPRQRAHRYAVVRLDFIRHDGELSALFLRLIKELGQICTTNSKAHIVLLLGPGDSWKWLSDRKRDFVLNQSRVTGLQLRRWSEGAIANAFDSIEARTGSLVAGEEVFKLTSGFHWLIDHGLSRISIRRSDVKNGTLVEKWKALCNEVLSNGGTESALFALGLRKSEPDLESCVWKVLRLSDKNDYGHHLLTDTSFELAAEDLQEEDGGAPEFWKKHPVTIREWIRAMGLARPLNTNNEESMVMASWVHDVIRATKG